METWHASLVMKLTLTGVDFPVALPSPARTWRKMQERIQCRIRRSKDLKILRVVHSSVVEVWTLKDSAEKCETAAPHPFVPAASFVHHQHLGVEIQHPLTNFSRVLSRSTCSRWPLTSEIILNDVRNFHLDPPLTALTYCS